MKKKLDTNDYSFNHLTLILSLHYLVPIGETLLLYLNTKLCHVIFFEHFAENRMFL